MDKFVVWFTKNHKCLILKLRLIWVPAATPGTFTPYNQSKAAHYQVDYNYYTTHKWTDFPAKLRWRYAEIPADQIFDTKEEAMKMTDSLFRKEIINSIDAFEFEIAQKAEAVQDLKNLKLNIEHRKYIRPEPPKP